MNRSIIIVIVIAAALAGGLYSLPKVVVSSAPKPRTATATKSDTTVTTQPPNTQVSSSDTHNAGLTPAQEKVTSDLRKLFIASTDPSQRVKSAIKLSDLFLEFRKFDSAAKYAEQASLLEPTELNMLRTGDRYYDAFGFAVNDQKSGVLGEKTRAWYQKVLDKNPNLLSAKANMAMTYVSTQTPMQGIMMLREVLASDPTNELALFNLGLLSMRSNQYNKAVERFGQILRNNPNNNKVRFYMGVSLAQTGKKKEALEALLKVKETEKDPSILAAIQELERDLK
jgi:tetratricopeptide (TPR) repeat protein